MALRRWPIHALLGLGLVLAGLGCADPTVGVKGRVTFENKPVEQGSISFEPADGNGPSSGGVIEHGEYELLGNAKIMPGQKIVRIRATRKTGRKIPQMPGSTQMIEEEKEYIPAAYNNQSILKADVQPGKVNELDFALKAKP